MVIPPESLQPTQLRIDPERKKPTAEDGQEPRHANDEWTVVRHAHVRLETDPMETNPMETDPMMCSCVRRKSKSVEE
jgi:hypothetical protein